MKQLILLRGCPGSGKSTFIKENGLESFTLSPDILRTQMSAPIYNTAGERVISQENDGRVWKLLFDILESRMKNGEFIIVDATHSTAKLINKYKQLRATYGYRTFVVNFEVPLETCLKRNKQRESYKLVPEEVIENIHERLQHENIPSFAKVINPDELLEEIKWRAQDFNHFNKVKVIGDVHGCYTALNKFITYEEITDNQDTAFIFVGDLFDRGLENVKVFEFIEQVYKLPNVFLIEGNHERHLRTYVKVYDELIKELNSSEIKQDKYNTMHKTFRAKGFIETTLKEFLHNKISKDRVKPILKKLLQCLYIELNGTRYIITHGGIMPSMITDLNLVSTNQLINGVGGYEFEIDDEWEADNNVIQIHGHRNLYRIPLNAQSNSINLEGRVEKGGCLRAITIKKGDTFNKNIIEAHEIENEIYDSKWLLSNDYTEKIDSKITTNEFINLAREEKNIKVKRQYDNVHSINFKSRLFKSKKWNQIAVHARGLFVRDNLNNSEVIGRAYNKFFNLNETRETKLENLVETLKYPLKAYRKENGFLGIMFYDSEQEQLIYASKSTTHLKGSDNQFALWFKKIVEDTVSKDNLKILENKLKDENLSAVFEVIDVDNDPHIVSYEQSKVVLLDLIENKLEFNKLNDEESYQLAERIGVDFKEKEFVFDDWNEFYGWYKEVADNTNIEHEGWVLEDNEGFMFKLKTKWYSNWKYIRGFIERVHSGKSPKQFILQNHSEVRDFFYWLRKQDIIYKKNDLIQLREKFREEMK